MYHCHHSKGSGGEIPVADGVPLGSLWIRSSHSGHPGANIPRSLSVERTDRADYSIFKVPKLLFTIHTKYEIFFVGCRLFFKRRLPRCGSATGFGESPQNLRLDIQTLCLQNHLPAGGGLLGPSFVPGGEKTGWESESCYDSLSAGISCPHRKSES